jgi:D-sedoheptulose 7-phosphate isomerase
MDMKLSHRVDVFSEMIACCIGTNQLEETIDLELSMQHVMRYLRQIKREKRTLYIVGNGGSAAVASHALVDFVNVAKIDARVLHESSLITCMANDFGYQNAYARVLAQCLKPEDVLIAISSSGCSLNICQAAQVAKDYGAQVVTLTGFRRDNTLRQLGDINFWLDSSDYGFVEVGHQFILHNLSDRFGFEAQVKEDTSMQGSTLDA